MTNAIMAMLKNIDIETRTMTIFIIIIIMVTNGLLHCVINDN